MNLTQFKNIDKELFYTPLTGADNLEKTFKLTKDDGGNWTISIEDYKELAEALVDHDESGSRAVYAERISIRIYQIINLKTVAIQAVSHQVRENRVLLHLMLNMYGKLFWTRRVVTPVAALFLLFVVSIPL